MARPLPVYHHTTWGRTKSLSGPLPVVLPVHWRTTRCILCRGDAGIFLMSTCVSYETKFLLSVGEGSE